jgi:2-polyprenyl-6-methoxyphenol hydroxylase-like FAD-dependent oxidoreductase
MRTMAVMRAAGSSLGERHMQTSLEVLIVGAGPVGLLLASELQRQRVDHLVIERQPGRAYFCKALGVTPRTLEIFDDLNALEDAIDAGTWLTGVITFTNGAQTATQVMDRLPNGLPYGFLTLPQYETERILEATLRQHGGAVKYGVALDSFTERPDGVEARLIDLSGTTHSVSCRWLVACDGAHSRVRKQLGLPFEGGRYSSTYMLGDVEVSWDLPRGPSYRFNNVVEGQVINTVVAVPIPGFSQRYRLSTAMPEPKTPEGINGDSGSEAAEAPTLERLRDVMTPMLPAGARLSNLRWSSAYRISHRIVPRYSVGRVLLAGDAAHIHPPIGGQGMNTGLQDAHNLAWKLVLAARGRASSSLLESYSAERQPVGRDVVEHTDRAMQDARANRPLFQNPAQRESQLFIRYRESRLVRDDVSDQAASGDVDALPQAGDRAPDADGLSRPFMAHRIRLRDRLGCGRHVLLAFAAAETAAVDMVAAADLLDVLRRRLGDDLVTGTVIAAPDAPSSIGFERMARLFDTDGAFRRAYGARGGIVWLIRPDGHIGWRSDRPDRTRLDNYLDRLSALSA